jgi:anti-anti-sigma factor
VSGASCGVAALVRYASGVCVSRATGWLITSSVQDGLWGGNPLEGESSMVASNFAILESQEGDCLRLLLTGELDIASAPVLEDHLAGLRASELAVRLDLSKLDFIDSGGLRGVIQAMNDARADGWRLQIDREVAPQAMRLFELLDLDRLIPGFDSDGR